MFSSHTNCTDTHGRLDCRKFFSSSTTSAATAWGFRDDKCDHTHPGIENTSAALDMTAPQGCSSNTPINHRMQGPPSHSCLCPQQGSAQSPLLLQPPSPVGYAAKWQGSKTSTTTKTESRQTSCFPMVIFAFIVISRGKRPSRDLNAKYNFFLFVQYLPRHVFIAGIALEGLSGFTSPPKALSCWTATRAGGYAQFCLFPAALPQNCSPSGATHNALESICHWLYIPSSTRKYSCALQGYVGEKKRVIMSKYSFSRPQATFLFISWWVGRRPRSFPKQGNNTRKT